MNKFLILLLVLCIVVCIVQVFTMEANFITTLAFIGSVVLLVTLLVQSKKNK